MYAHPALGGRFPVVGGTVRQNGGMANRLANEAWPYLRQHAHKSVDWWPRCPDVFEEADGWDGWIPPVQLRYERAPAPFSASPPPWSAPNASPDSLHRAVSKGQRLVQRGNSGGREDGSIPMSSNQKTEMVVAKGMPGEEWEGHRAAVFGVAYRLLGSVADAEDVVQDVWLRTTGGRMGRVENPRAWLVTVAARCAYDLLRSARVRREEYVGPWLPEPLMTGPDAAQPVLVDESVGSAMMLVLEELSPPERVAFVLRDVFGLEMARIAGVLGRSPAAARQLATRARRRIDKARGAGEVGSVAPRAERERVLRAFRAACETGDLEGLVRLLNPDVVYITDGGGEVFAARKPIVGGRRVAEVLLRVGRRWRLDEVELVEVGGETALLNRRGDGSVHSVDTVHLREGRIVAYWRQLAPSKLAHL